ncbi:MAG: D-tyrosyl-tRNA(Tyr) deacylase [Herminiimonas sp.]|nr:D-tyrosyl-tRNA(Tyr) deacylase [Herminiimonas sp.]
MIGLIQRVTQASVSVDHEVIGQIAEGLLVLVCAERHDSEKEAIALVDKIFGYRVFPDENGRMNRSLSDIKGQLLLVPQFTLAADTRSGTRPSFTPAASPDDARRLFDFFTTVATRRTGVVQTGRFGAHMQVTLTNDGPVTFWLQVEPPSPVA